MNLQPKILSNAFLINGYTPAVDMILVILCILLLLLLRETFIRRSRLFLLFRTCIALLLIAAFSNSCFYYTVLYFDSDTTLCILRAIYHSSLLLIFCLYAAYLKILIGIPGKTGHIMNIFLYSLYIIFAVVDALSPVLGYSFYRDSSGAWHDNLYLKPFTIAYGIYMAFIFFLLLYYHKRIPTSLFHMLVIVQFICVFLVCAENYFGSNTFLAITFLLPIIVILYMVHGSSYSIKTGALNADSLNEYLNQQASIQISTYYMCLRFDTDSEYVMPDELGKLFFNFWNGYFKNGLLFHPSTDFFVLAIDVSDIRNADKIAQDMIQNDFKRHFETYKLPYKIVMFNHLDFCENLEQFYELFNFFAEPMELNNFRSCDTADYKSFHDMKYLLAQLKDIAENGFLDDKRVLVYCQPIRNVNAGNYDTAEALMRLNLKDTGMVYPNRFIPLAEKNGYIHKLSMIILNKTCRAIREFQDEGYQLSRVSVNLSISELSNKNFMEEFRQIVERNGVDFHTIAVELTESRNDTEYELVLDRVMQFKSLGVCTYLDDFGTGYSNFDRILSLKLDVVKFDRSLLLMANKDENSQFILNYFSTAFKKLGYKVLYEGVETDEQETICVNSHADYLQGFKFSKPIPIEELKNFLSPIQE